MFESVRKTRRQRGDLFDRIGQFLDAQGLSADPANYALAHAALADPTGPLAAAVGRLTDGGVRLSSRDVEALGGASGGAPPAPTTASRQDAATDGATRDAAALVARTQAQVDGFASLIDTIRAETSGFGRDLAESTAELQGTGRRARTPDEIARLAAAMVARVRDAEQRLANATRETDALREKLVEACDAARRDALTGLPNRLAFDEAFSARDTRPGPYALAICDIDNFKKLNDRHGHQVGDRVLRSLAQTLDAECDGQLVVRYGGEEFAILTAGLDLDAATALVDRARAAVATKRLRNRETDSAIGQISFSAGVTMMERGEDKARAFERADRLLYQAKAEGRDQVIAG
jgi:diguanylate cyclase